MAGIDQYTKLMLHMDGSDGDTIFPDLGTSHHLMTPLGGDQLDDVESKFGGTSLYLDGAGDYTVANDHADWDFGSGDFTIDLWFKSDGSAQGTREVIIGVVDGSAWSNIAWMLSLEGTEGATPGELLFQMSNNGGSSDAVSFSTTTTYDDDAWHHVAVVRNGTAFALYVDGIEKITDTSSLVCKNHTTPLRIGYGNHANYNYYKGWIDEIRVSKGIARWTSAFTPPTEAYTATPQHGLDSNVTLMLNMDGADGSTTFTDDSDGAHSITADGNAQVDTALSVHGGTSAIFDGTSNTRLDCGDHDDFDFATGDFTIDFWFRINDLQSGGKVLVAKWIVGGFAPWLISQDGTSIIFYASSDNANWDIALTDTVATGLVIDKWYHFALTRSGSDWRFFLDGVQTDSITNASGVADIANDVLIGGGSNAWYFKGNIDSVRLTKGQARWIGDFNPPLAPYTVADEFGIDEYSKLMLHMDGTDQTFVDSSISLQEVTANGDATQSAAQSKFGGKSLLTDGTGDYLSIPDSDDWDFGTEDFTIDCWFRVGTHTGRRGVLFGVLTNVQVWSTIGWFISLEGTLTGQEGQLLFQFSDNGGSGLTFYTGSTYDDSAWHHVAVVREGNIFTFYVDGIPVATSTQSLTCFNMTEPLKVGYGGNGTYAQYLNGNLDEVRVTKGLARWTSSFIPSTSEYIADPADPLALKIQGGALTQDAYTDQGTPGSNAGTNPAMLIRSWATSLNLRAHASFDFSELPENATILSATLSFYYYSLFAGSPAGRTYDISRVTQEGWIEDEVTWDDYKTSTAWTIAGGDFTTDDQATAIIPAPANWIDFDVTAQVEYAQINTSEIAHFLLKDQTEESANHAILLYSNNETTFTSLRPKLVIMYELEVEPEPPSGIDSFIEAFQPQHQVPRQRYIKKRPNIGHSETSGMHLPIPIKMDKWSHIYNVPARQKKKGRGRTQNAFVEFNIPVLPEITLDKWFFQDAIPMKRFKKVIPYQVEFTIDFVESWQVKNGNYQDTGVYGFSITDVSEDAADFEDTVAFSFTITGEDLEDFQLEDDEVFDFSIEYPDIGNEVFNSGVPGFISANVTIDGVNESTMMTGVINVVREDNSAARFRCTLEFDQTLVPPRKPAELINKVVSISFAAADMDGVVADYVPIFVGLCKHVSFSEDVQSMIMSGYDYGGVHQTRGEFVSDNVTDVLTGQIYIASAAVHDLGQSPVWGIIWTGNTEVTDGEDYFINTLTGSIIVPISSRILQFPGVFQFNYQNPFNSMKEIVQSVATIKGWTLAEDNVTIADYSNVAEHPVLSLSDESVVDVCRKFLELSGAKVESNLYPNLRVYSEVQNVINTVNTHTVDEDKIFENTLQFRVDFDDILNEQTTRSVQKINANVVIGAEEALGQFSGDTSTVNPFTIQTGVTWVWNLNLGQLAVLAEHRIRKTGLNSISFSSSGRFHAFGVGDVFEEPITGSSWNSFIDGDDFVVQLKHDVVVLGHLNVRMYAYPAVEYQLTINGSKINYGDGTIEDVKMVTAQRPIGGVSETLKGDVYENPYIETDQHCANICDAILLEHGNPYTTEFEIPVYEGKHMNIGDRINIEKDSSQRFAGLIKRLNYSINLATGANSIIVNATGVGFGI